MLEATKKPPTETIHEARFLGPEDKVRELRRFADTLGLKDVSDALPWRALFPEIGEESSPAVALRGARGKEGLTQKELSEKTGIPQSHISEMENNKMSIGKERAKRLGKALQVSYRVFL
jgi:hypothetical protein